MTVEELTSKLSLLKSHKNKDKLLGESFLRIYNLYKSSEKNFTLSDEVQIDSLARDFIKGKEKLYKTIKKDELLIDIKAGNMCLINNFLSLNEVIKLCENKIKEKTRESIIQYIKCQTWWNRVSKSIMEQAINLLMVSEE